MNDKDVKKDLSLSLALFMENCIKPSVQHYANRLRDEITREARARHRHRSYIWSRPDLLEACRKRAFKIP